MSLLRDAESYLDQRDSADAEVVSTAAETLSGRADQGATTGTVARARAGTVEVDGEEVSLEEIDTQQPDEDGTWLTGTEAYGRPRGIDAMENRQIVQTSAMQAIVNGIAGQLLGGDLTRDPNEDVLEDFDDAQAAAAAELWDILRDVIKGPHIGEYSLDDLVVAVIEDMLGPGNGYWRLVGTEDGSLPVATLQTLDPLTIRQNKDRHGQFGDPAYWQAHGAFSGGMASMGAIDPVPLTREDIVEFAWPYGNRSYNGYPKSPAWQVREWLEVLANSTTNLNRHYNDSEVNSGLLQVVNASGQTVEDIKQKIEDASGDPHSAAVVGGEGGAQWIELGGQSLKLDEIANQRWFFFLCVGALGMGKHELGMVEDINRSNGEVEATRVYKRVTAPVLDQFRAGFRKIAMQFDAYSRLGKPWDLTIDYSDPREHRAKAERYRKEYQAGIRTFNQVQRALGNDPDDMDTTVEVVEGEFIDYGDLPRTIVESVMISRRMAALNEDGDAAESEEANEQVAQAFDAPEFDAEEE